MRDKIKKGIKTMVMKAPIPVTLFFFLIYRKFSLCYDSLYRNELCFQKKIFAKLGFGPGLKAIDIGAANGITNSNIFPYRKWLKTYNAFLFLIEGDYNSSKYLEYVYNFKNTNIHHGLITTGNAGDIFFHNKVPKEVDLLTIDIDSYDYYVLDAVLSFVTANLIIAEINERFPPSVYFNVSYEGSSSILGGPFYGMSMSAAAELLTRKNYKIIGLFYNNIYAVPIENKNFESVYSLDDLYADGYKDAKKRKKYFYWNDRYECTFEMNPEELISFFESEFENRGVCRDDYSLRISCL